MCFALSSTLLAAFFIHFWGQSVSHLLDASTIKHFRSGKKVCNFSMTQRQATRFLTQILCVCKNGWFTGQILSISKPYNVGPFINPMNTIVIGTINHSYWSNWTLSSGPHFVGSLLRSDGWIPRPPRLSLFEPGSVLVLPTTWWPFGTYT
jgi:hypothetical protein